MNHNVPFLLEQKQRAMINSTNLKLITFAREEREREFTSLEVKYNEFLLHIVLEYNFLVLATVDIYILNRIYYDAAKQSYGKTCEKERQARPVGSGQCHSLRALTVQ